MVIFLKIPQLFQDIKNAITNSKVNSEQSTKRCQTVSDIKMLNNIIIFLSNIIEPYVQNVPPLQTGIYLTVWTETSQG